MDGRVLTGESESSQDTALHHAAEILSEQIAFANIIILTKVDTIPKDIVDAQVATLQKLQPHAAIGLSAQAGLLLPQLDAVPAPKMATLKKRAEQFDLTQQSATADDVEALIFRDPRPFHPQRLHEACQNQLSTGLYRTKGFLWIASRPGYVLLWQQSGSQISLELSGLWRAELAHNREGKLFPEEIEHLREQLKTKHPTFGDRHNELTLIGLKESREAFLQLCKMHSVPPRKLPHGKTARPFLTPGRRLFVVSSKVPRLCLHDDIMHKRWKVMMSDYHQHQNKKKWKSRRHAVAQFS